jgi:hypothetical protein
VYVLLGDLNAVVDFITNLYDRGLLDTGEYIVIYVDLGTFDITNPLKYFKRKYLVQKCIFYLKYSNYTRNAVLIIFH